MAAVIKHPAEYTYPPGAEYEKALRKISEAAYSLMAMAERELAFMQTTESPRDPGTYFDVIGGCVRQVNWVHDKLRDARKRELETSPL